jgi:parvulin-like peptidyl-prolyl isomerase
MKKLLATLSIAASISISAFAAQTLAKVNDKAITDEDVQIFMMKNGMQANYNMMKPEVKQKLLEKTIETKLIADEAIKNGIENTPEFKENLEKAKVDIALDVWTTKELEKITISDEEAKKFYDANSEKFKQPHLYNASHILVKSEAEAKKIIKEIYAAKDKSEAFAGAAEKYSIDGNGKQGGSLGWFPEGQMVKDFMEAVKKMKKGDISKTPVKTQFGFHIIMLNDEKAASKATFDQVKERIKQGLKIEKTRDAVEAKGKALREKAKVELVK